MESMVKLKSDLDSAANPIVAIVVVLSFVVLLWAAFKYGQMSQMSQMSETKGLTIYKDHRTGCEYYIIGARGITARLGRDGQPICGIKVDGQNKVILPRLNQT